MKTAIRDFHYVRSVSWFSLAMGTATLLLFSAGIVGSAAAIDVVTGTDGNVTPHVKTFISSAETSSFLPYGVGPTTGVRVAAGDVNGDGVADVVTGLGSGVAPHVKVFSGGNLDLLQSFFAYGTYDGGIFVAGESPVVPEPGALALMCAGASALICGRGARRK